MRHEESVDEKTGEKRQQRKAAVCDLCTDMCLGENEDPACVYACPHEAAHRMRGDELLTLVQTGVLPRG